MPRKTTAWTIFTTLLLSLIEKTIISSCKGMFVERQGRKAIGSKLGEHDDT